MSLKSELLPIVGTVDDATFKRGSRPRNIGSWIHLPAANTPKLSIGLRARTRSSQQKRTCPSVHSNMREIVPESPSSERRTLVVSHRFERGVAFVRVALETCLTPLDLEL